MRTVVIVGGGISGLSTAFYLRKAGIQSTIIERAPRLGGVILTDLIDDCVVEGGPDSFLAAKPWAMDLIRELGLESEVIGSNDHLRKTYIVRNRRLHAIPEGLVMMAPSRFMPLLGSSLLSWSAKLRMGMELFRASTAGDRDRSVTEFLASHYGREAVEYLAEPLLAGVYGGDPDRLSASSVLPRLVELERKHGSITRGLAAARSPQGLGPLFRSLKHGMGQLVEAVKIAASPEVIYAGVEALDVSPQRVRVRAGGDWLEATHAVLASPAYESSRLLAPLDPELGNLLAAIPYSSSMTVALGYERPAVAEAARGFGFLVPRSERRGIVACTWVHNKFQHRAPEHMALARCFFSDPSLRDDQAIAAARDELRELTGLHAEPVFTSVARWPRSMAQYTVGHAERVKQIEERSRAWTNVHLAGNAYYGIGVPDCIRLGKEVAARITAR